jgi:outer membrane protein assembly factor BamB
MTSTCRIGAILLAAGATAALLHAQGRGGAEWTTIGGDAQRTASMKTDPRISPESMMKGGPFGTFKFLWKLKLEYDPKAATVLTPPILLNNVIGFRGFKSIVFVGTQSETLHAIDYDMGVPLWKYHINYGANPAPVLATTPECPGGLSAAASRPTAIAPPAVAGRGLGARGARSGGGVGEPGKGAITIAQAGARGARGLPAGARGAAAGAPAAAQAGAQGARGAVPARGRGGPFQPGDDAAYIVGSDGYLHALNVQSGWEQMTPVLFLPPNTRAMGLIVASSDEGRIAYAATTHHCGAQDDAIWAIDLRDAKKTVSNFRPGGAAIAGTEGPAIGHDGTVYAATAKGSSPMSNSVFALDAKTLNMKGSASVNGAALSSSPVVIAWKEKDAVVVAGGGKLYLFDASALSAGPVAVSPLFGTADYETGALASWTDAQNTRWIAASTSHAVTAFKLTDQGGRATFESGWTSREIASPLPPVVANGVLFAASTGTKTTPAVLYGLDATSGKELWNSGRGITSTVHGALAVSQGNVFVPGTDGTLYAFGFEIEK